jgi:hypothetical protein
VSIKLVYSNKGWLGGEGNLVEGVHVVRDLEKAMKGAWEDWKQLIKEL